MNLTPNHEWMVFEKYDQVREKKEIILANPIPVEIEKYAKSNLLMSDIYTQVLQCWNTSDLLN